MALPAAQSFPLLAWFKLVNDTVNEPYLDEVFHVQQAQHYCQNHFSVWDSKITTPPGLYLLSYLLSPIIGCDLLWLRSLNLFCLCTLQAVLTWTYATRQTRKRDDWITQLSALNITLLPPLFFFSALYYTDVASTLSVLFFYWLFLHTHRARTSPWLRSLLLVLTGAMSLLFRQTNIFWVALFPAGVVLVNQLDKGHRVVKDSMYRHAEGFGDSVLSVAKTSWKMDVIFDPPVKDAWLEDYFKTAVSILACSIKLTTQPKRFFALLGPLAPYITLIAIFASFVIWNGGVVLGDKSNHVATLHLPQMLYIWPYFTFFSWPLLYPYLLTTLLGIFAKLPAIAPLESMLIFRRRRLTPRLLTCALFLALALLAIAFNTIVHPFTLADNRHYTFYIFRLLLHPWWVKYAVSPLYLLSAWACIQALSARPDDSPDPPTTTPLALPDGTTSATTTFVLIWLTTTTLTLTTAPLVEPRYLILPWTLWRLHLPFAQRVRVPAGRNTQSFASRLAALDRRLLLETAWLVGVNAGVGWVFLRRGFVWEAEPERVQRFLW